MGRAMRDAPPMDNMASVRERAEYLPTPRQIVSACAAIRRCWTPAERRRRAVGGSIPHEPRGWFPPRITTGNCVARVRKLVADASA